MTLNEQIKSILFTTVRIKTRLVTGEVCFGTAFVVEYQNGEDNTFPFLVTAKSLVEKAVEGRVLLVQARGKEPIPNKHYVLDIDNFGKLWYPHPDYYLDVAITPFVPFVRHVENSGTPIYFQAFTGELLGTSATWSDLQLAQETLVMGFPAGHWDDKHSVPIVKTARISFPPWLPYRGQPQILLDTSSADGWVGSPVLVRTANNEKNSIQLLGMLNRVTAINSTDEDLKESESTPDMSVCIKSDAIVGAIITYLREKGFI